MKLPVFPGAGDQIRRWEQGQMSVNKGTISMDGDRNMRKRIWLISDGISKINKLTFQVNEIIVALWAGRVSTLFSVV